MNSFLLRGIPHTGVYFNKSDIPGSQGKWGIEGLKKSEKYFGTAGSKGSSGIIRALVWYGGYQASISMVLQERKESIFILVFG